MRTTHIIFILYYVVIHSSASVFRDGVIEACRKCCDDAYANNEDSKLKCFTTLQNGYEGSYIQRDVELFVEKNERSEKEKVIENDPAYKNTLQGLSGDDKKDKFDELLKLPQVQAMVKANADAYVRKAVTNMKKRTDEICQYEMTISSGLTPERFAFMIASALGQYHKDEIRKFTDYFKAQTAEKQQKIIDLTPSFWQLMYRHARNFFDKLNEYYDMLVAKEFKTFLDIYDEWFPIQIESCKIEEVAQMFQKYKDRVNSGKEEDYKSEMQADINKCAAIAKNAAAK